MILFPELQPVKISALMLCREPMGLSGLDCLNPGPFIGVFYEERPGKNVLIVGFCLPSKN